MRQPARLRRVAIAAPMPEPAPVMTAIGELIVVASGIVFFLLLIHLFLSPPLATSIVVFQTSSLVAVAIS